MLAEGIIIAVIVAIFVAGLLALVMGMIAFALIYGRYADRNVTAV